MPDRRSIGRFRRRIAKASDDAERDDDDRPGSGDLLHPDRNQHRAESADADEVDEPAQAIRGQ